MVFEYQILPNGIQILNAEMLRHLSMLPNGIYSIYSTVHTLHATPYAQYILGPRLPPPPL